MASASYIDSSRVDISKFIQSKSDVIIVSDVEGFCAKEQIAKIIEYASGKDNKGVIFNGDVLDYTVGILILGPADPANLCALKLLKVLTDGMKEGHVICNIGNRDINKIKLLALLQTQDNSYWWVNGGNISEIATNLLTNYQTNSSTFWKFNDLRSINPFWNKANGNFKNERWLPPTPIIADTLLSRFEYIFGDDPAVGTISAKNNLDGIHQELGIVTTDQEHKAAIVFTVFARMLFMNSNPSKILNSTGAPDSKPFEYDGLLKEYLTLANAASYAVLDNTLLLFGHGGFTKKFFANDKIIDTLRTQLTTNVAGIENEIMALKIQAGGTFVSKMEQIVKFNADVKKIINTLFVAHPTSNEYIRTNPNSIPFLSDDLMILTILSTPATNNKQIGTLLSPYETALSPIQTASPISEELFNSIEAMSDSDNVSKVINIFSHIPKGFGYSFGKTGAKSYFINTDFYNTLLKDRTYLTPIETNPSYLVLHLEKSNPGDKWQFRLDGMIEMNIRIFAINHVSTYELSYINKLNPEDLKKMITKDTILTDTSLNLDNSTPLVLKFDQSFSFDQLDINTYHTNNLFYHGIAKINDGLECKVYSFTGGLNENFKKHLYLMPIQVASIKKTLFNKGVSGGSRRKTKRNKSKRAVRKSNKRIQRK